MGSRTASIVIRTLNEERYLPDLLRAIREQVLDSDLQLEVVLVDSGSTDSTVRIAQSFDCNIVHIDRRMFSFGRSLNWGCERAAGDILVFISGHCVPVDRNWLSRLCQPLRDGVASYAYGRQVGDDDSFFSERRIFAQYYSGESAVPQSGFFCNNANSALLRDVWSANRFDEDLTGLEDMELARRIAADGHRIAYVAEAPVYHHHRESWAQIKRRFEREAIALQNIMPAVHLSRLDVARYFATSVLLDFRSAWQHDCLLPEWLNIVRYRWAQYSGSHKGNHELRRLSQSQKERFFYPSVNESDSQNAWLRRHRRAAAHEGEQPASKGQEL
jgi:glycosyltransferase involved in cell wall biosynthesis